MTRPIRFPMNLAKHMSTDGLQGIRYALLYCLRVQQGCTCAVPSLLWL